MDPTLSITKGVFVFKNGSYGNSSIPKSLNVSNRDDTPTHASRKTDHHATFKTTWRDFESCARKIYERNYRKTVLEIENFITGCGENNAKDTLPTAALLTGINQTDHFQLFETLSKYIRHKCSALYIILDAKKSLDLLSLFGQIVTGFIHSLNTNDNDQVNQYRIPRQLCAMRILKLWYKEEFPNVRKKLVIIIPSFECYKTQILQDMILILQAYCKHLPIILVLGVATAVSSLHKRLPYHISSKMQLRIFQFESAITGLNNIIQQAIFSPRHKINLSGKVFAFLTDTFLFYDFSINGMLQGIKYCLMEHTFQKRNLLFAFDDNLGSVGEISLSHEVLETIRQLPSFRSYVENIKEKPDQIILLLTDDEYLEKQLPTLLKNCYVFLYLFRCFLEFFSSIVGSLPKTPSGQLLGEIYSKCVSSIICESRELEECWQTLSLLSKFEFLSIIEAARDKMIQFSNENIVDNDIGRECKQIIASKILKINFLINEVRNTEMEPQSRSTHDRIYSSKPNKYGIEDPMLERSNNEKKECNIKRRINEALIYIKYDIVYKHLIPFTKGKSPPLLELFLFSELWSVRRNIVGAPGSALLTALNDPQYYLQCNCCELQFPTDLLKSMPDLCIAYKLHLESGRMINLYDYLLAFRCVIEADSEDAGEVIDPDIQARFARAVAELQFLGYVKSSKRKTDHVARLTW